MDHKRRIIAETRDRDRHIGPVNGDGGFLSALWIGMLIPSAAPKTDLDLIEFSFFTRLSGQKQTEQGKEQDDQNDMDPETDFIPHRYLPAASGADTAAASAVPGPNPVIGQPHRPSVTYNLPFRIFAAMERIRK